MRHPNVVWVYGVVLKPMSKDDESNDAELSDQDGGQFCLHVANAQHWFEQFLWHLQPHVVWEVHYPLLILSRTSGIVQMHCDITFPLAHLTANPHVCMTSAV